MMSGLQCHKRLWLESYHRHLMVYGNSSNAAFAQGNAFGDLSRELIAVRENLAGHLVEAVEDPAQALKDTAAALPLHALIFEPAFRHEGVFVRCDALLRIERGEGGEGEPAYTMIEVKASSTVKPQHIRDTAVQTWVARGVGLNITRIELGHVDTQFTYQGQGYNGLLKRVDITAQVETQILEVAAWVATQKTMLRSADMPDIAMGRQCNAPYPCPFVQHCTASASVLGTAPPQHSIFMLPTINGKALARRLQAQGYADLLAVPVEMLEEYAFVQQAHRSGQAWHDSSVATALLQAQPKPWAYLDFETISPAVPLWAGTRPFAHWPFQWSVHAENANGTHTHSDFLDLSGNDPSEGCITQMLAVLGDAATVWAYNAPFERQAIDRMAVAYPQYAPALTALAGKLQDLIPIVQAAYYHPAMQGSYSIKAVLPAIAPELSYHDLEGVQDGNAAQGAFFEAVNPATTPQRKAQIDRQLRAYCKLDTWAMVVLVARLLAVGEG